MDKYLRPCIAELLGTFLFVFIGGGVICTDAVLQAQGKPGVGLLGIAIAHGLALAIAVSATMNVSGGHINPAITTAFYVLGKIDTVQCLYYIVSQLLGAAIAGFFLSVIFGATPANEVAVGLGTPHVTPMLAISGRAVLDTQLLAMSTLIEMLLTFCLAFAVFGTVVDPRATKIGGWGIGLMITACILVGGPFTGASMNPARTFGTGLWEAGINGFDFSRMKDFPVYVVGPVLGAILAGWLYTSCVLPPSLADERLGVERKPDA